MSDEQGTQVTGTTEPQQAEDGPSVEDLVKGKKDILTQIIDNVSFTVGGETFEEGDDVDLAETEKQVFLLIKQRNTENRKIKQWLLNRCHTTTRKLIPEIRPVAHLLAQNSIEIREKVSLLISMIHERLGGLLPMKLDDEVTKFTVRAVGANESLNYTVARCLELIGITPLTHQRDLSFCLARKREDSRIDMAYNVRLKFQPITVRDFMPQSGDHGAPDADFETRLLAGITKYLEDHPRTTKTLIMLDADLAHIINLDIQETGRWEKIVEYAGEVEPHIIYVLETIPGKDPKKTEAAVSSILKDEKNVLVKKTWKFQIRVPEKRVKRTEEIEGEFHSKPEDQYEDLLIS